MFGFFYFKLYTIKKNQYSCVINNETINWFKMRIMSKEINETGSKYIIYVMDDAGSPLKCEYANIENKENVISELITKFGEMIELEEMTYNDYINQ
jgi:hypothetical protein